MNLKKFRHNIPKIRQTSVIITIASDSFCSSNTSFVAAGFRSLLDFQKLYYYSQAAATAFETGCHQTEEPKLGSLSTRLL
jgi:hypothetical protein